MHADSADYATAANPYRHREGTMRRRVFLSTLLVVLLSTVSVLSAHCEDLDRKLLQSCKSGDLVEVENFVKKGARVTAKDSYGWTPLILASKEGHTAVVEYLLKHGADPNVPNSWGWFPISWAAFQGHADVVKLLLKNGANPDAKTDRTWTPETLARETNHKKVLSALGKSLSQPVPSPRTAVAKTKPHPAHAKRIPAAKGKALKRKASPSEKGMAIRPEATKKTVTEKPPEKKKPVPAKKGASAQKMEPGKAKPKKPGPPTKSAKEDFLARATKRAVPPKKATARKVGAQPEMSKAAKPELKKATQPSRAEAPKEPTRPRIGPPPKKGTLSKESLEKKKPRERKIATAPKGGSAHKAVPPKNASGMTKPEPIGKPKLVEKARPGHEAVAKKPSQKMARGKPAPEPKAAVGRKPVQETAVATGTKPVHRFRDKKGYFSIVPPAGWTRKDFPTEKERSMILFHEPTNRNVSISVIALPKAKSKGAFYKEAEKKVSQLKTMFPKGTFKLQKSKLAGMDALVMENTIPGTVKQEIWQVRGDKAAYTITYLTSTEPQFEEFLPLYKSFLQSFKPLHGGK